MRRPTTVVIEGIGPLLFVKSRRAKKLNISLEPSRMLRVAVPYFVSIEQAKEIISSNPGWVKRYLSRMARLEREHERLLKVPGDVDREEAGRVLLKRVEKLAGEHGFVCNNVFIREQKTRWGSCSAKNNISLNIKLLKLPAELMDYVIFHELVHTKIKSHKRDFWKEMDRLLEGARDLDRRLRKYQLALL